MSKNLKIYHTVYQITNLINENIYIGVHKTTNPYDSYLGSGLAITRAIEKYGKENFKKEILKICDTQEESYQFEALLVDYNFVCRTDTYNLCLGGGNSVNFNSVIVRPETREKISKSRIGNKSFTKNGFYKILIVETGEVFLDQTDTLKALNLGVGNRYKLNDLILSGKIRFLNDERQEQVFNKALIDRERKRVSKQEWSKRQSINMTGRTQSEESIEKTRQGRKEYYKNNPEKLKEKIAKMNTPEAREKANKNRKPQVWTDEMKKSHSIKKLKFNADTGAEPPNKNKKQIVNPITKETTYISNDEVLPNGWEFGSPVTGSKRGVMYNNGTKSKMFKDDEVIPEGWTIGRLNNRTWYYNPELKDYKSFDNSITPPDGWRRSTRKKHQ